ncbi:hypothetical protein SeMB42_g07690 [Synchytrium endobioticum]|uniref:Uncharacterized protein n=1 Tax=Synchytrium endobioticum TaxID=286115 RepID=A0A507C1R7_9FUNG|nr:hypothetical protein SeMB42_g07690 [Synchytrium endobioticum]
MPTGPSYRQAEADFILFPLALPFHTDDARAGTDSVMATLLAEVFHYHHHPLYVVGFPLTAMNGVASRPHAFYPTPRSGLRRNGVIAEMRVERVSEAMHRTFILSKEWQEQDDEVDKNFLLQLVGLTVGTATGFRRTTNAAPYAATDELMASYHDLVELMKSQLEKKNKVLRWSDMIWTIAALSTRGYIEMIRWNSIPSIPFLTQEQLLGEQDQYSVSEAEVELARLYHEVVLWKLQRFGDMARESFKSFYGIQEEILDLKESVRFAEKDWNEYVRDLPDGSDRLDMYMNGLQRLETAKEFHSSLLKTFDEFAFLRKIPVSDIEEAYHVITKNDHWKVSAVPNVKTETLRFLERVPLPDTPWQHLRLGFAYHTIQTMKTYVDRKRQDDPNSDSTLEHHTYLRAVYLGLAPQDKIEEATRDIEGVVSSIDDVTPASRDGAMQRKGKRNEAWATDNQVNQKICDAQEANPPQRRRLEGHGGSSRTAFSSGTRGYIQE